jgi:putative transposase
LEVRFLHGSPIIPRKSSRYGIYGLIFQDRVKALDIEEVVIAPHRPWQNPYAERVIGTLRRECLDHVVVLWETHLRRIVRRYVKYYHGARTHLALDKDAPETRSVQPAEMGRVIEIPEVGGLHHRYERRAA